MKLSICMMVKDEEKSLRKCLDSLKMLIDKQIAELIIVDTGSTDQTVKIAREYTEKIYFHRWNKNFSEMRNKSISYATGEWIFIIDADECVENTEILYNTLMAKQTGHINTLLVQVKNLMDYEVVDKYNMMVSPRLFKNDGSFRYEGAVHNQPIYKKPMANTDVQLIHYGYIASNKELMEKKYHRTVELLLAELEKEPDNLYYLYQLGVSYNMHDDNKNALEQFRKAYAILEDKKLIHKRDYNYILASHAAIAYANDKLEECIQIAKQVIATESEYIDMYYILGLAENKRGNQQVVHQYFEKYMTLIKRYKQLSISSDLTITMYYINEACKQLVAEELIKNYIEKHNYEAIYETCKHIGIGEYKNKYEIYSLLGLNKYGELYSMYSSIQDLKQKELFLFHIENWLVEKFSDDKELLYNVFKENNDSYALYCKIMLEKNYSNKLHYMDVLMAQIALNEAPVFYLNSLLTIKDSVNKVVGYLEKMECYEVRRIIKYLINKDKEYLFEFERYIINQEISNMDLDALIIHISMMTVILFVENADLKEIDEIHGEIFEKYVQAGVEYVQRIYQMDSAKEIYKYINLSEDKFFVLMHLIKKEIKAKNKKQAIKYILEAAKAYPVVTDYVNYYKNIILDDAKLAAREFETYKKMIKKQIQTYIDNGEINHAEQLLNEYQQIAPTDIENYSILAVIYIMREDLKKAEIAIKEGLQKQPYDEELLVNQTYILDTVGKKIEAMECFNKMKLTNPKSKIKLCDIINLSDAPAQKEELNVVHGTMEIANQMHNIVHGLNNLGVKAKTINFWPNYLGYSSDCVLDISQCADSHELQRKIKDLGAKLIAENDVFHFHFGTSLTLDYSDLPLLKELNKKVIMQYWGSDVRLYSKAIQMNPYVKVKNMDEDSIKRKLEVISKYIPNCLVDYELGEYVKDYHEKVHYTKFAMDLTKYSMREKEKNEKLLIVHAPTSPEIKGTQHILNAIEKLKEKYNFDFRLVQGVSHEEAIKIYRQADLIIDQIIIGSHGVLAVEAMAMGKPVICWISDFMKDRYPKELPIISANPDNIIEKIEYAIKNKDMLTEIGKQGRKYVEKYHDLNIVSREMLEIYKQI